MRRSLTSIVEGSVRYRWHGRPSSRESVSQRFFLSTKPLVRQSDRFKRNVLKIEALKKDMERSSMVFFMHGQFLDTASGNKTRKEMKDAGFKVMQVKSSLLMVTGRENYTEESSILYGKQSRDAMEAIARGPITMIMFQEPLTFLLLPRVKGLIKEAILNHRSKKTAESELRKAMQNLHLVGVFLNDKGKSDPAIWLTKKQIVDLTQDMEEFQIESEEDCENIGLHNAYLSQLTGLLTSQLSQTVQPLEAYINQVPSTVEQSILSLVSTLETASINKESSKSN